MAPNIPLIERPPRLRRAVFDIALHDGVAAITQPAVAARVGTSLASIRRWARATELPRLGLEWVLQRQRLHQFEPAPGEVEATSRPHRALNSLLRDLPFDDERRDEERVWSLLTWTFADDPWFRDAVADRAIWTEKTIGCITDVLPRASVELGRVRLKALVLGARGAVREGVIEPRQSVELVRQEVLELSDAGAGPAPPRRTAATGTGSTSGRAASA